MSLISPSTLSGILKDSVSTRFVQSQQFSTNCTKEDSARPLHSIRSHGTVRQISTGRSNGTYGTPHFTVPLTWILRIVFLLHNAGESKEGLMFVRKVTALLKPNSISKFSILIEKEVIPILRQQSGFEDILTFYAPSEDAVTALSLWDKASSAQLYSRGTYPIVLAKLSGIIEGIPTIDTYEIVNSSFHKIAAAVAA
jgi:hypothetical protein